MAIIHFDMGYGEGPVFAHDYGSYPWVRNFLDPVRFPLKETGWDYDATIVLLKIEQGTAIVDIFKQAAAAGLKRPTYKHALYLAGQHVITHPDITFLCRPWKELTLEPGNDLVIIRALMDDPPKSPTEAHSWDWAQANYENFVLPESTYVAFVRGEERIVHYGSTAKG